MTPRKRTVIVTRAYDADEYVSIAIAAAITGRSYRTLYRWIATDPPAVRAKQNNHTWQFCVGDLIPHIRRELIAYESNELVEVNNKPIRRT